MQTSRSAVSICLLAAGFACTAKAEPIESGLNFGGPDAVPDAVKAGPRPTEATRSAGDVLISPR